LPRDEDCDEDLFAFYWTKIVGRAAGTATIWNDECKFFGLLSTAKPEEPGAKPYITASTEAFAVLAIENCAKRWPKLWAKKREIPDKKVMYTKKGSAPKDGYTAVNTTDDADWVGVYTTTDAGQRMCGGWTLAGLNKYKEYLAIATEGRAKDTTEELEQKILDKIRADNKITAPTWAAHKRKSRGGTGEPAVVAEVAGLLDLDDWDIHGI
jgi:hypothetical protein